MRSCASLVVAVLVLGCSEETPSTTQGNRPPVLQAPGAQIVLEGTLLQFTVTATDLDEDPVTFGAVQVPEGAAWSAEGGVFTWVPTYAQAGSYNVPFSASDGRFTVQTTVSIAVVDRNRPPVIDGVSDVTVVEGQQLELRVSASDPDGDSVSLEASALPQGASFDEASGRFAWGPGYRQAGAYTVTFVATDSALQPISVHRTLAVQVENYVEALLARDFLVLGTLGDGTTSDLLAASLVVELDFAGQTGGLVEMRVSNLVSMADGAWQPFAPRVDWLLAPGDGLKTVRAQFRDGADNVTPVVEGTITLDTTPPAPAIVTGPALTNQASVTLQLVAADENGLHPSDAVFVWEDGGSASVGPIPFVDTLTFPLPGDGPRTLRVRLRDKAGNDAFASLALVKDTAPPVGGALEVVSPTGNDLVSSLNVAVRLQAPTDAAQMRLAVAGDASSCADSDLLAAPLLPVAPTLTVSFVGGNVLRRVCARLYDAAGNASAWLSDTVLVDQDHPLAAPFTLWGLFADGSSSALVTSEGTVLLDFSAQAALTPDVAWMKISNLGTLADAEWRPFAASAPWLLLPGPYTERTVYARFRDAAGNESLNVAEGTIDFDATGPTAPSVRIIEDDARSENGFTRRTGVNLQLGAAGAPVRAVVADNPGLVDPLAVNDLGGATPFTLGGVGPRSVWARFYDAAGNPSDELGVAQVTVDQIAPSPLAAALVEGVFATAPNVTLVAPAAGQDEVRVHGDVSSSTDFVPAPPGSLLSLQLAGGDGPKTLRVDYRDLAENVTQAPDLAVVLDQQPPEARDFSVQGALADGTASTELTASPLVTLQFDGQSDRTSFIREVKVSNDEDDVELAKAAWQAFALALPWTLAPPDGERKVFARFQDAAGKVSARVVGRIALGAQPPSGGSLLVEGGAASTSKQIVDLAITATGAAWMAVSADGFAGGTSWVPFAPNATADLGTDDERVSTVTVRLRNRALVEGPSATASIYFDHTAPRAGTLRLLGSLRGGQSSTVWTTTPAVTAQLTPAAEDSDVVRMALAQRDPSQTCAQALASPSWEQHARSATFVLSGADGFKSVCATLADGAGNFQIANAVEATITLDTAAPTNPAFLNVTSGVTSAASAPDAGSAQVSEASDSWSPVTYQCFGGQYGGAWTDCGTLTRLPAFQLARNTENILGVRARDAAGNASAGSQVRLVHDDIAPGNGTLTLVGALADGSTSSAYSGFAAITAQVLRPSTDAAEMALVQDASCSTAFSGTSPWRPFAPTTSVLLLGANGVKQVCLAFRDGAGNFDASSAGSASIILDTRQPLALDLGAVPEATSDTTLELPLVAPPLAAVDANLSGFELAQGTQIWSRFQSGPPFTFALSRNALNLLWVRAVDQAGNAGPATGVRVDQDDTPPQAPIIQVAPAFTNAPSTAVSLSGADTDPHFDGYQVCTTTVPLGTGVFSCPSECGVTFSAQAPSFPIALAPDRATCIYARAKDSAGNISLVSQASVVDDLQPPARPELVLGFDPSLVAVRTERVDLFLDGMPMDDPPALGIAYLEIDAGDGFRPLCPECSSPTYAPCSATCACADPRRVCSDTSLAAVRVPLTMAATNRVQVRAVDLAGNEGASLDVEVVNEGGESQPLLGTASRIEPQLWETTLTFWQSTIPAHRIAVELGPNRVQEASDPTCDLLTGPAVAGAAGVLYGDGNTSLALRRRGADGLVCTGDDAVVSLGGGANRVDAVALWGERAAWVEQPSSGDASLKVLEAGTDGVLTRPTGSAAHPNPILIWTTPSIGYIQLAGRHLLAASPCGPIWCWRVFAAALGGFSDGWTVSTTIQAVDAALNEDGTLLVAGTGNPSTLTLYQAGPDGILSLDVSEQVGTRSLPGSPDVGLGFGVAVDRGHAVGLENPSNTAGQLLHWSAGMDGLFATADDTFLVRVPSTSWRTSPTLSRGFLAYRTGNSNPTLASITLSSLRWEVVKPHDLDYVATNGAGALGYAQDAQTVAYARNASGMRETSQVLPGGLYLNSHPLAMWSRDLLTLGTAGPRVYSSGANDIWFEPQDGAPFTPVTSTPRPFLVHAGEGKALLTFSTVTPTMPVVIESSAGSLHDGYTVSVPNCASREAASGLASAGISARRALWITLDQHACVHESGTDGVFGAGDPGSFYLNQYPTLPGTSYTSVAGVAASGNRVAVRIGTSLTVIDAGSDQLLNTANDQPWLVLGPAATIRDFKMSGDWLAFVANVAAGDQVFLVNLVTRVTTQETFHLSSKTALAVDPSGRVAWSDGAFLFRSVFLHAP